MKHAMLSSVATFHTKKIIFSDATKFSHIGSIPETMYMCVSSESNVMTAYRKLSPKGPRELTPEMQVALDVVEKPVKRGKKADTKKVETEGPSTKTTKSKKRKAEEASSSTPKKVKTMARRPKNPSFSNSEHDEEQSANEDEEVGHEGSPRGNPPPRSPTPTEQLNDKIPTPPPSPLKNTVPASVAPIPPPPTTQNTTTILPPPPVSTIPFSTTPLPPPIISQATTTTTPISTTTT